MQSPASARTVASSRLRTRLLLVRRQSATIVARRPYAVVVEAELSLEGERQIRSGARASSEWSHSGRSACVLPEIE